MEPIRLCLRRGEPGVCDQNQRWGYCRASILRPRGPFGAASARVAKAPRGADAADLTRRPVRPPVPLWGWALLHRADDARPVVARATQVLTDLAATCGWLTRPAEPHWPPSNDERV